LIFSVLMNVAEIQKFRTKDFEVENF